MAGGLLPAPAASAAGQCVRYASRMTSKPEPSIVAGSPQWWAERPDRSLKAGGRGRPSVGFDRIIDVALEAVDEVGPDAFNMRLLAERMSSGTATLYRHFKGKDEILAYVADRVLGNLSVDRSEIAQVSWKQAMRLIAVGFHGLLQQHPNIAPLLASQIPLGPNGLRLREGFLSLLLAHEFSQELAARAYVTMGHYVLGFAVQHHASASLETGSARHELKKYFAGLDREEFPSTVGAASFLSEVPTSDEFEFGLGLILDGLERAMGVAASRKDSLAVAPRSASR